MGSSPGEDTVRRGSRAATVLLRGAAVVAMTVTVLPGAALAAPATAAAAGALLPVGTTYYIVNENSQRCLNVEGASTANGAPIVQWSCDRMPSNWWYLRAA
jgi:hypothetical protein